MPRSLSLFLLAAFAFLSLPAGGQIPVYDWARATANKPQPTPLAERLPVEIVFVHDGLALDRSVNDTAVPAISFGLFGFAGLAGSQSATNAARERAQSRMGPMAEAMSSYPFETTMEAALRAELSGEGISPDPQISVRNSRSSVVSPSPSPRILTIYPYYAMNGELTELRVKLFVQIVEREVKDNGARYRDKARLNRIYSFAFQIEDGSAEEKIERWSAFEAEALRGMLDRGIEHVAEMLAYDFSVAGRREWRMSSLKKSARIKGRLYRGLPVRETPEWVWVRTGTKLQGFEGYQPLDRSSASADR